MSIYSKIVLIIETIRIKIQNYWIGLYSNKRRRKIEDTNFTLISNNCWGGKVYKSYGIVNQSPTIGLVIYPDDYIKFCSNMKYYCSLPLEFIDYERAMNYSKAPHDKTYPVGRLDDIEIHFLHYRSEEELVISGIGV